MKKILLSVTAINFFKSFIVAVFGGVVAVVAPSIQAWIDSGKWAGLSVIFDWTVIWHTAVAAGIGFIMHKITSLNPTIVQINPEKTTVLNKETKEVIVNAKKTI